ncbi:MAG TPA: hypothetical protein DEB40_11755 [Elusimicrobia bacterium]|nr:hypothetical protein [Elusimicrobiota bacterium]HBT62407.1 hypothetical protein [Elusimicrobiota bacterium]
MAFNADFMKMDRQYRRQYMPGTLAHELLGHGLAEFQARKAGVLEAYNPNYRGNEDNAALVGWTVTAELGAKLCETDMWSYLENPEEYGKKRQLILPVYAITCSPKEIKDAASVLRSRLARTKKALSEIPGDISDWRFWRQAAEHFIAAHKMARKSFRSVFDIADSMSDQYLPMRQETLKNIQARLEKTIARLESPAGSAEKKRLQDQFQQSFFVLQEARLKARREHLQKLVQGRSYEPFSPLPPGQISLDQLKAMYSQDRLKRPEHWTK